MQQIPKISDFLDALAIDPGLTDEYGTDPDGVMTRFGLTDEQKELIRSGSLDAIRAAIQDELGGEARVYLIKYIIKG